MRFTLGIFCKNSSTGNITSFNLPYSLACSISSKVKEFSILKAPELVLIKQERQAPHPRTLPMSSHSVLIYVPLSRQLSKLQIHNYNQLNLASRSSPFWVFVQRQCPPWLIRIIFSLCNAPQSTWRVL